MTPDPFFEKRSFRLAGHATSVALEPEFWQRLEQLAHARHLSLPALVLEVDKQRAGRNLSSALRVCSLQTTAFLPDEAGADHDVNRLS